MKPIQKLDETAKLLDWIRPRIAKALTANQEWAGLGYGTGGGEGRSNTTSDPTATVGTLVADQKLADEFARRYGMALEDCVNLELAARRLEKFIRSTDTIALTASSSPEGCFLCSQVRDQESGRPHENGWQPIHLRRILPSQPHGAKQPLCSFHADFIDRYGIEPDPPINLWHLQHPGSRIPYNMIRDAHPEEFSLAQSRQRGRALGRHTLGMPEPVSPRASA